MKIACMVCLLPCSHGLRGLRGLPAAAAELLGRSVVLDLHVHVDLILVLLFEYSFSTSRILATCSTSTCRIGGSRPTCNS